METRGIRRSLAGVCDEATASPGGEVNGESEGKTW